MVRVFCDFDGTISLQDVGAEFFRTYAREKAQEFTEDNLPGRYTIQEWIRQLCEAIPSITQEKFLSYVDQFSIDPHFIGFVSFCQERNIPLTVLSDGLDAYVGRILSNAGLGHIPFFANRTKFVGQQLNVSFPYTDAECSLCGNCKRNHMLNISADEDILVYVGDGYSDRCPVRFADYVFAKHHLRKYCQQQNISFYEFHHFGDVQEKLEEILQRKHIRCRQEAVMARREVFAQG
jgi:2-hydroxy-3-keto-5-methylthiopentenyl-1-phosphate phosphatase